MTADSSAIRVVVVDDHPLFRIGIISLLETLEGVEVVGSAETADKALIAKAAMFDRIGIRVNLVGRVEGL